MDVILGQLIAAAFGATAALLVVYLTHKMTMARSVRDRLLQKAEELLGEILKFSQQSQRLYDLALDAHTATDPDEFDVRLRDLREARLETYSKVRMLTAIYYPKLQHNLNALWPNVVAMDRQVLNAGEGRFLEAELKSAFASGRSLSNSLRAQCLDEANKLLGNTYLANDEA